MHSYDLNALFAGNVFAFMLLLARLGMVIMLFPGIGESYVPPRTRMIFACLICFLLLGPMAARLPVMPSAPFELGRLILIEMVVGFFFGTLVRLVFGTLEATGMLIGVQTGLSNATMLNPAQATQSPLSSAFLSMAGLVLIFITGLDHFILRTAIALYDIFPAGEPVLFGDMAQTVIRITNQSFVVGIELAAPFVIMGMLLSVAVGLIQRLMPSIQLFMIMMPIEIWGGLALLSLTMAGILTLWLRYVDHSIGSFFQG